MNNRRDREGILEHRERNSALNGVRVQRRKQSTTVLSPVLDVIHSGKAQPTRLWNHWSVLGACNRHDIGQSNARGDLPLVARPAVSLEASGPGSGNVLDCGVSGIEPSYHFKLGRV